jgi:hypothetical protein
VPTSAPSQARTSRDLRAHLYEEHRAGAGGSAIVEAYTSGIDRLIAFLFDSATAEYTERYVCSTIAAPSPRRAATDGRAEPVVRHRSSRALSLARERLRRDRWPSASSTRSGMPASSSGTPAARSPTARASRRRI